MNYIQFILVISLLLHSIEAQLKFPTTRSSGKLMFPTSEPKSLVKITTPAPAPQNILPKPGDGVCGKFSFANRIHGGNETDIGEYPWLVLLEYTENNVRKGYHCGGSLISNRYVLTAAHCLQGKDIPKNWEVTGVRLGEWDTATDTDCILLADDSEQCSDTPVDVDVQKIIVHDNYNPNESHQYNDIALLRLETTVNFTEWISPICLPSTDHSRNSKFDSEEFDVAGWGRTEFGTKSNVKLKATLKIFDKKTCKINYSKYNINLTDNQICAGGVGGIDTCRGDSGGPLIGLDSKSPELTHYFLAGIISFGPNPCGMEGWPGIYTRVGGFVDWIQSKIEP